MSLSPLGFAACQSKNCTDIFKTHTSLLVQLGQLHPLETTAPPGDNCTPWRQLHPLKTTAPPGIPAPL